MAINNIALCSRALLKIGANGISSFNENSAEAEIASNLYPQIRDALLSSHPWSFALGQRQLPRLLAEPVADYKYAYQLPTGFLRAISAGTIGRGRGINYRIAENRLHTDAESVVLTYIFRPEEMNFPPFFDQLMIAKLAAEFCLPITENTTRTQFLMKIAEDEFRKAKLIDAQQDQPDTFEEFPLVDVR